MLAAMLGVLAVIGAWSGDWRGAATCFFVFANLSSYSVLPRVTVSEGRLRYTALHGSFEVRPAQIAGVVLEYVFRAPDSQPISLTVKLRGEDRDRVLELDRFSRRDVARILSFFSISPPGTTR